MQIKNIDFNIDLAQSFGFYKNNSEFDLLDYASSVNISCGFHAGDPLTIKNALMKAKEKNVVVGAHIGFDDIQGFGYRDMDLSDDEIEALVIYQVGALMAFAKSHIDYSTHAHRFHHTHILALHTLWRKHPSFWVS